MRLCALQYVVATLVAAASLLPVPSFAAPPATIGFTGLLTNPNGTPKPNGDYAVTLALYDAASGGHELWHESKTVHVTNGLFSTALGDVTPLTTQPGFWSGAYFVGVTVGSDPEMQPRFALQGAPYAMFAFSLANNAVYNQNIANDQVTASKLATDSSAIYKLTGGGLWFSGTELGINTPSGPQATLDVRGQVKLGSSGQYFAPGSGEDLRIIRGTVSSSGAILRGSGFTATRTGTGRYTITFSQPFPAAPSTTSSAETVNSIVSTTSSTTGISVLIINVSDNFTDSPFDFIVAGPK